MNLRKTILSSLFVCGASSFFAAAAFAAEEGGKPAGGPSEAFKWINFAIVALALVWFFRAKGGPWFRENAKNIGSAINRAQAAKAEADRRLEDAAGRLARLEEDRKSVV